MNRIKKICKGIDNFFNRFIQKGGNNTFLEYTVKYFMACGIGFNLLLVFVIITQIVT